ncbi:MAG: oligosaccharide flippase family protein, partial [Promethearchaeota archaeon]
MQNDRQEQEQEQDKREKQLDDGFDILNMSSDQPNTNRYAAELVRKRSIKTGFGFFSLKVISNVFELIKIFILTQLLSPVDFGIVGSAFLTINTISYFSNLNLEYAMIRKKEDIRPYLNTAWTFNLIKSILSSTLLIAISPIIAQLFKKEAVAIVLIILVTFSIFRDSKNIGLVHMEKSINYKKIIAGQLISNGVSTTIVIVLAFAFKNYWSMVIGYSIGFLLDFIISYIIHPYRPKLELKKDKLKDLLHFGKWILFSTILVFLITEGDDYIVGAILGVEILGLYQLSYKISCLPTTEVSWTIARVTMSSYSLLQDDLANLKGAFLKTIDTMSTIATPLTLFIFIFSGDVITLLLPGRWYSIIPFIKILCLWGWIRAIGSNRGSFLIAINKPAWNTAVQLIQAIIIYAFIFPMINAWGVIGVASIIVISAAISNPAGLYLIIKRLKCDAREFIRSIIYPVIISISVGIITELIKWLFNYTISWINTIFLISIA